MANKIIRYDLSEHGIESAIRELTKYKQELEMKVGLLREKVAKYISQKAQSGFNGAVLDDLLKGGIRYAEVEVEVTDRGNATIVVAKGQDAIWVEFGAGVYHNTSAGSSPHPKGSELGFVIGGYGKGLGRKEVWGFYEDGELKLTHGTPSVMPMYNAMSEVCREIAVLVREVFG